jgi:hypothetical protein
MSEIYLEKPYLTLYLDEQKKLAIAEWKGVLSSAEYREAFMKCLELMYEKKLENWVGDNRKMKAISEQDQEWTFQVAAPLLLRSTLRKMATLVSEDIYNQMAVTTMFDRAAPMMSFENQYFKDFDQAMDWLNKSEVLENQQELNIN